MLLILSSQFAAHIIIKKEEEEEEKDHAKSKNPSQGSLVPLSKRISIYLYSCWCSLVNCNLFIMWPSCWNPHMKPDSTNQIRSRALLLLLYTNRFIWSLRFITCSTYIKRRVFLYQKSSCCKRFMKSLLVHKKSYSTQQARDLSCYKFAWNLLVQNYSSPHQPRERFHHAATSWNLFWYRRTLALHPQEIWKLMNSDSGICMGFQKKKNL